MSAASQEAAAPSEEPVATFQDRVKPWMMACFGSEISGDKVERGDRLLEEVLELLQSGGYDPARVGALRDYVWGRPAGEPPQEVGGVQVTLAAYCLAFGLDMHAAGETELARIWTKVDKIRAKQAAKPVGSALPVASPAVAPVAVSVDGPDEIEIDRLRLAAFQTNSNDDKAAYYLAVSKWFQDRHYRASRATTAEAERDALRAALRRSLVAMKLVAALPGVSDEYYFALAIEYAARALSGKATS